MHNTPRDSEAGSPDEGFVADTADAKSRRDETGEAALDDALVQAREESLRLLAELDNQRKRSARDVAAAHKFGTERLLGDLLPIADSLERGLETPAADSAKLREGMRLTLAMLEKTLASHGLEPIEPLGKAFDPQLHQAMSAIESEGVGAGVVAQVFQKGYVLNGRLVRPALVVVGQ